MAKDIKTSEIPDLGKDSLVPPDGNNPPTGNLGKHPSPNPSTEDDLKEQNGNPPSALSVSDAKATITILRNRTLRHNGIEYKGGTTLDLPTKDADFLIKHYYAVAGSLLPEGGFIVPKTHNPKAGSDAS